MLADTDSRPRGREDYGMQRGRMPLLDWGGVLWLLLAVYVAAVIGVLLALAVIRVLSEAIQSPALVLAVVLIPTVVIVGVTFSIGLRLYWQRLQRRREVIARRTLDE